MRGVFSQQELGPAPKLNPTQARQFLRQIIEKDLAKFGDEGEKVKAFIRDYAPGEAWPQSPKANLTLVTWIAPGITTRSFLNIKKLAKEIWREILNNNEVEA